MRTAAVLLLILPVLAASPSPVASQVTVAPPPAAPIVEGLQSEGRVTRVDRATRRITLDTGNDYVIPTPLEAAWTVVRDGSEVRVRYNVDGGQNVVTHLQVIR
jgi:Protein of unknown function (DUF1344)